MAKIRFQLQTDIQTGEHEERKQAFKDVGIKIWTWNDIKNKEYIGAGAYGKVELLSMKSDETSKRVLKTMRDDQEFFKRFIKEIKVLAALQHPNIVSLLGAISKPLGLMMEYVAFTFEPYGIDHVVTNLRGFLNKIHEFNAVGNFHKEYDIIRFIAKETVEGLSYLHKNNIAHRDLKPSNILVGNTKNGVVDENIIMECKIADFGEARSQSIQTSMAVASRTSNVDRGTVPFQAPEAILGYLKTANLSDLKLVDVWAYGCILFCLLNPDLAYPFEKEFKADTNKSEDLRRCIAALLNKRLLPELSETYRDLREMLKDTYTLMVKCMSFVPANRPTFDDIREWFKAARDAENLSVGTGPADPKRSFAVVVSGIPKDIDADFLELWFESEHRSGGGVVEELYCEELSTKNCVTITYQSVEVAERVAETPQRPKGIHVNVELLTAESIVAKFDDCMDDRMVLITNMPAGSSIPDFQMFFQRHENYSVESVVCGKNQSKALVKFQCPIDFMKITRFLHLRPYRGRLLSPQQVAKSKAIQVNGVKGLDPELVYFYFQSGKSGGGRIVKYDPHPDEDYALIYFETSEVFHAVLEEQHILKERPLRVSILYECLGVVESIPHDGLSSNKCDNSLRVHPKGSVLDTMNNSHEYSHAIVVTDIPPDMDRDYLMLWFESERRSGGGFIEDFFCDDYMKSNSVTITYKSNKVARRVKSLPQRLKGNKLSVALLAPAVHVPCLVDDRKVVVRNSPPGTKDSSLRDFFLRLVNNPIEHIERYEDLSKILLTFRYPIDFGKTIELTCKRPFRGRMLSLEQVSMSNEYKVEELQGQFESKFCDKLDHDDLDHIRRLDVSIDDSKQRFDQPVLYGKWKIKAEDPVFVQVYATLPKELYDKLDDDDLDHLRRCDVSIHDSKQRFDQPILCGKLKQLVEVKWNLQTKYFPLTIKKHTHKKTRLCADTTDEANIARSEGNKGSQLKLGNTPQYENDDRQNVANYPAGTEVISVRKGSEAQSGNEDLPSNVSTNVDSPTDPNHGSTIPSYNQVPACSPPVTSNIPRQHPCTIAAECKIQPKKEPSAGHHQHSTNPVPEPSITSTQKRSQHVRNKGHFNLHEIYELNSSLSADENKEERSNSEHIARREQYGLFHMSEEKGNGLRNKGQDINHQEDVQKILTGNTPTVQHDEVPSSQGPTDGVSSIIEKNSGIFTTENKETAQKQQNSHQNNLWQAETHDSNNLSNFRAAATEPGTLVEQTLERDNELEANDNPRDDAHNLEPENFNQEGDVLAIRHQGQLGLRMEKRDTFRHTPSPTPIGNKPVDMDIGDRETSQSSEQIQFAHKGARPKTTHTQERTLYTGNLPTFITDKYLWLWYKHSHIDYHERTMRKYHCTMEEHLIDGRTKDLEIVVRSDRGGSKEGQLDKCMDDVTQTLVSIQCKHEIIEMSMPRSYTHHLGINTNLPEHTYICGDLNEGTVIIGVNKVDIQSVYDWLNSEDNDSKGNKGAEHTNTTTNPGTGIYSNSNNNKHATDDENTGDGNQDTGEKEKAVKMDYHLFRYIGKFHKKDLTNIKEKYNVKVKADTLENGHGVRLQGFDLNVRGAYEEITRFIVDLNEVIRSDTIEVSPDSYSELEITEIIDCLKQKYDGILLEHRQNTIFLIGDQELLSQAKHELQSKLSGIEPLSGKNVDQYPRSSRKRNKQLMQPLVTPSNTIGYTYSTQNGRKIHIFKGDITKLLVDAVVNASNTNLRHGGGVAGAISKAAGPQLQAECSHYVKQMGTLQTSDGYVSSAYNMPCQCIIHVVGPRWSDYSDKKMAEAYLAASFRNVLAEADRLKLRSIAIPAVGSGLFGAPLDIVARTMFDAVSKFVEGSVAWSELRDIILVDINAAILELLALHYEQAVSKEFIQSTPADFERFIRSPGKASAVKAEVVGHRNSNSTHNSQLYGATPNSSHRDSSGCLLN